MPTQTFRVRGRCSFPVDMLRYDSCFPKSELDSATIMATMDRHGFARESYDVELIGTHEPTVGRWLSFSWNVVLGT